MQLLGVFAVEISEAIDPEYFPPKMIQLRVIFNSGLIPEKPAQAGFLLSGIQ